MKIKIESVMDDGKTVVIKFFSREVTGKLSFNRDVSKEDMLKSIARHIDNLIKQTKADMSALKSCEGKEFSVTI